MDELIKKVYTDVNFSSAAYGGIDAVLAEARKHDPSIKKKDVVEFFDKSRTYTLHRPARRNFKTRKTYSFGLFESTQIDLMDMSKYASARENQGMKWLLVLVDVLSKRVYATPTKTKGAVEMQKGLLKIFDQMGKTPNQCFSDQASVVERMNRTIRGRLARYMTEKGSKAWVPVIDAIIKGINETKSRVTGMRPIDVTPENADALVHKLFAPSLLALPNKKKPKFQENATVRVKQRREQFERGYEITWSDRVYKVEKILKTDPIVYKLKDGDQVLDGTYYNEELGTFKVDQESEWRVEILKTRKRGKKTQYFVRWLGFSEEQNSWVNEEDLAN